MRKRVIFLSIIGIMVFGLINYASAVPSGDFLAFGTSAGDSRLGENDDGSTGEFTLGTSFEYFGETETSLWVNNNGNITFDSSMGTYTPFAFPGSREIIAPFFADVDTRGTGDIADDGINDVYYSERTDGTNLAAASAIIDNAFGGAFGATYLFVATWDHVGYFSNHWVAGEVNTFQVILVTDGAQSYTIFNYLDDGMYWETGDASGGTDGFGGTEAVAGFDRGNSTDFAMIQGSRESGIANVLEDQSNVGVAGQWVFQVNEENIIPPIIPEPGTVFLLGAGLLGLVALGKKRLTKK